MTKMNSSSNSNSNNNSVKLFSQEDIHIFIKEHPSYIEGKKDNLFNIDYNTIKPLKKEVFNFIEELTGQKVKTIKTEEFQIYSKNLNKVRSEYKKIQRKNEQKEPEINNPDEEQFINNIYYDYENVCKKVIKFTKCYVFYQYPELTGNFEEPSQDFVHKCKISADNEVIWKPKLYKEQSRFFFKRHIYKEDLYKPLTTIEEIKNLEHRLYCD